MRWIGGSLYRVSGPKLSPPAAAGRGDTSPALGPSPPPRVCEATKTETAAYASLFRGAFHNRAFHVYRLKKKRKRKGAAAASSSPAEAPRPATEG